jgi:hypothetical protein
MNKNIIIGGVCVGASVLWVTGNWLINCDQNSSNPRLPDKNASPGYYFIEGLLDSTNPVSFDNHNYAKIIATTKCGLKLEEPEQSNLIYFSNSCSTSIEQINTSQKITIDEIDVSEFINDFPMTTIRETNNSKIQGIPINLGKWRLSGYYDGEKLRKKNKNQTNTRVQYEYGNNLSKKTDSPVEFIFKCMLISGILLLVKGYNDGS